MKQTTLNILGTEYTVCKETEAENPGMIGNSGLCEPYSKRIILDTTDNGPGTVENYDAYCHRVLRHEAFHAIFHEAGWTKYHLDEDLVEALAILYPKIQAIMEKADSLDLSKI